MLSKTHIGTGILATLGLIQLTNISFNGFELIPGAILGSTFPDIDTSKSWAAQTIPFVDDFLRKLGILKHRKITHGITGTIASILIFLLIRNDFTLGFTLGWIFHILLDIIAKKLNITCKQDNKVYNIVWIINIILIIIIIKK